MEKIPELKMKPTVLLLDVVGLVHCAHAIRVCRDNIEQSDSEIFPNGQRLLGEKDQDLIKRIGVKSKHESVLEHIIFEFRIKDISRACLQEIARHRMASITVRSSRYTLKKHLAKEEYFEYKYTDLARAEKYVVLTGSPKTDKSIISALNNLISAFREEPKLTDVPSNKSNDVIKYALPEALKTEFFWTINARSLRNFLHLRTSPHALKEIRLLSTAIYLKLKDEGVEWLFEDVINQEDLLLDELGSED